MKDISEYLSGEKLYGDDFPKQEIEKWYESEKEAYANLGSADRESYQYSYHPLNILHGFSYLPERKFEKALGMGSAYGDEFLPIISKINEVHILEPSDQLVSENLNGIKPIFHKPSVDGLMEFESGTFDLITCFGTLHHIPNVSTVLAEMERVLKPGGYMLLREPIMSMGDWRKHRQGLSSNERGIPRAFFRKTIDKLGLKVINESFCFTMTHHFERVLKRSLINNKSYIYLDKILSKIFSFNTKTYHRESFFSKMAPGSVFYVLKKDD